MMNSVTYSTKCTDMKKPYFKVEIDAQKKETLSLVIFGESLIVNTFSMNGKNYVFTLFQCDTIVIIEGAIKGTYIQGDDIHILSLPFRLLQKFGCMKSN